MIANGRRWKPVLGHAYVTLGVLAGAYRGRDLDYRSTLTHLVEVSDGWRSPPWRWVGDKTVCRRVPLDSVVDEGSAGSGEGLAFAPTCPICLERYNTVLETIGYEEHVRRLNEYYESIFGRHHESNGAAYYVWVLRGDTPLDEGPYGPYDLEQAKSYARISATEGQHDRAVSRGQDAGASSFEFVRRYRARTGERIL